MQIVPKLTLTSDQSARSIFSTILKSRHLELAPPAPTLPSLLKDIPIDKKQLAKAKKIILQSIKAGKDILVYGDYDADGLTATAIMWTTLMGLGKGTKARILPFIPDRIMHGYGLSPRALADIRSGKAFAGTAYPDFRPALVVTVDNGIVANDEIKSLVDSGIQVIVTDHHQPASSLPPANCIIHSDVTSGAGIAWLTALFLTDSHPAVLELIGIATLGIVADQMKLVGVNRAIVMAGLRSLTHTKSPGISALKEVSGITSRVVTAYDINFGLAPRLNAVGRLDSPMDGLRLLCTRDQPVARYLAAKIEIHNRTRQELTDFSIKDALSHPVRHKLIFVASPEYHEGIIGLVAGKLAEAHHRPAVVVAVGKKICKGSARSVPGVNVTAILRQFKPLFQSVGGHEQAAGFSLKPGQLPELKRALVAHADTHIPNALLEKTYSVDAGLTLRQCTKELTELLRSLEPYGLGNPKPTFVVKGLTILETRSLKEGLHHKLTVEQDSVTREVIWFNSNLQTTLKSLAQLVFSLDLNKWREREYLQLVAKYVEP